MAAGFVVKQHSAPVGNVMIVLGCPDRFGGEDSACGRAEAVYHSMLQCLLCPSNDLLLMIIQLDAAMQQKDEPGSQVRASVVYMMVSKAQLAWEVWHCIVA